MARKTHTVRNVFTAFLVIALTVSACCFQTIAADQNQPEGAEAHTDSTEAAATAAEPLSVSYPINWSHKYTREYGRIVLSCPATTFCESFELGDIVYVEFPGRDGIKMPVCAHYDDVSAGEYLVKISQDDESVSITINYGVIGVDLGYLKRAGEQSDNAYQFAVDEKELPAEVNVTMAEKGGYTDMLRLSELTMSTDRDVYSDLDDEAFCNFRDIRIGSIEPGRLYRSASPINPSLGRSKYADPLIKKYGIRTIINMTDSEEDAKDFPGYEDSCYSACDVYFEKMGLAIGTDNFNKSIARCLRIVADCAAPCLIHCEFGKDRTGILCALIEGLCGAGLNEILEDYVITYDNFYVVEDGKHVPMEKELRELVKTKLIKALSYAYDTEINDNNFNEETEKYIKSLGLTDQEIERIRNNLQ